MPASVRRIARRRSAWARSTMHFRSAVHCCGVRCRMPVHGSNSLLDMVASLVRRRFTGHRRSHKMNNIDDLHLIERYMDLSGLRIFRAVVREGGITRAAERLHRVQSNVTTRIRQLEDDLGAPLFIREGKRLHLTPSCHVLLVYADWLLSLVYVARVVMHYPCVLVSVL